MPPIAYAKGVEYKLYSKAAEKKVMMNGQTESKSPASHNPSKSVKQVFPDPGKFLSVISLLISQNPSMMGTRILDHSRGIIVPPLRSQIPR
jgi:hypothetical protein